jgi:predicted nucleic acid-binding protein
MIDGFRGRILVDTNILLRISRRQDPQHRTIQSALLALEAQHTPLYYSLQNLAEFWNVCTRPRDRNGYGLTVAETNRSVEAIEKRMTYLPESEPVVLLWRRLIVVNDVRGVQVHDARLAAMMLAYGLTRILTLNQSDFLRYPGIQAFHPGQVLPASR